jgi:hypothetical protein
LAFDPKERKMISLIFIKAIAFFHYQEEAIASLFLAKSHEKVIEIILLHIN